MRLAWLALLPGLLPATAHAAVGEAGPARFVWEIVNLLLLLAVLFFVARKPVVGYFGERRRAVAQNMESAERLLGDAEARLAEWSARAERLEEEVAQIKSSARRAAEQEREAILAEARATAERIRRSAGADVERELLLAKAELRREVVELAVELAGSVLREKLADADRARLFDDFVSRVEAEETH